MAENNIPFNRHFKLNRIPYSPSALKVFISTLATSRVSFEKEISRFLSQWLDDSATIEVKTSGSTGNPKIISLQKKHMVNSALATGEFFDLREGDSALLCLSADYIAGKMMLVRAMVLGLELDYVTPSSKPLTTVSKPYDFCAMVPMQVENSIEHLHKIKTFIVGGAPMSHSLKEKIRHLASSIYETYGMTETITHVAVKRINNLDSIALGSKQNTFIGLPNVCFSKDDRDCLRIEAPMVSDDVIATNDVVELISEREFHWLGRFDNVVNSGGVKLHPENIEQKLSRLLENRFFVAGLPDAQLGQCLVLIVEGKVNKEQLLTELKHDTSLNRFEIPKSIFTLPSFLETDTGKIHRKKNLIYIDF